METDLTNENQFRDILLQLTKLSEEMNDAVKQKDLNKIEQVHVEKMKLINKLNLLITAKDSKRD